MNEDSARVCEGVWTSGDMDEHVQMGKCIRLEKGDCFGEESRADEEEEVGHHYEED